MIGHSQVNNLKTEPRPMISRLMVPMPATKSEIRTTSGGALALRQAHGTSEPAYMTSEIKKRLSASRSGVEIKKPLPSAFGEGIKREARFLGPLFIYISKAGGSCQLNLAARDNRI